MTGVFSRIQTSFSGLSPANFNINKMMSRAYEALPDPVQRSIKEYAVEETLKALTKDRTIHIAGKSIYTIKATRDYSLALVTLSSVAVALYNKDKISTAISSTRNSAANIAEKLMLRSAVSDASTLDACAEAYSGAKDKVGASISRVVTSTSDAVESAKTSASNAAARASTTIRMSPEMAKLFVSSRAESCNEAIKARILAYLGIDASVTSLAEGNEKLKVQLEVQKTELDTVKAQLNLKLTLLQGEVRKLEKQLGSQDLDSVTLLATAVGLSPLPINSPLFTRLMPSVTQRAPAVSIRDEIKALKEAIKSLREDLARPSGDAEAIFSELPSALSTPVRSTRRAVPHSAPSTSFSGSIFSAFPGRVTNFQDLLREVGSDV